MTEKIIIVEGLDNSGKNTWVSKNYPNATVVDFPVRDGKHSREIERFLRGESGYSKDIEVMFLENRLEWYREHSRNLQRGTTVLVRSGISYLAYKWYRTGKRPSDEEFERERELLRGTNFVFLDTEFPNPGKAEIYDSLGDKEKGVLRKLFMSVISEVVTPE